MITRGLDYPSLLKLCAQTTVRQMMWFANNTADFVGIKKKTGATEEIFPPSLVLPASTEAALEGDLSLSKALEGVRHREGCSRLVGEHSTQSKRAAQYLDGSKC